MVTQYKSQIKNIYVSQVNITGQFLKYFKEIRCTLGQQLFVHFWTKLSDAKCFRNPCVKIIFALLQNLKIVNVQFFVKTDRAIFNMSFYFRFGAGECNMLMNPCHQMSLGLSYIGMTCITQTKRICRQH